MHSDSKHDNNNLKKSTPYTHTTDHLVLNSIQLIFENSKQSDNQNKDKTGEVIDYAWNAIPLAEDLVVKCIIDPTAEEANLHMGPCLVLLNIQIIYEEKVLDEISWAFVLNKEANLKDSFPVFIHDFATIYLCICKSINPDAENFYTSEVEIKDPDHKLYNFLPLGWFEQFYQQQNLEKPEWWWEFFIKVKQIEMTKNNTPIDLPNMIWMDQTLLVFQDPNPSNKQDNNKAGDIANTKPMVEILFNKNPHVESIHPMAEKAEQPNLHKGTSFVQLGIQIMYRDKLVDQLFWTFKLTQGAILKKAFMAFLNDFIHIYYSMSKILNPQGQNLFINQVTLADPDNQLYSFLALSVVEQFYKINELKKPEWLEEFYVKLKEIQQIQEGKKSKKSE